MKIDAIPRFVVDTIKEIKRIDKTFLINGIDFELNVEEGKIKFSVVLKKETELQTEIGKEIIEPPIVIGMYDEDEEAWIKKS